MKNIILIGMMGSGKSFIGRALSQCLKMDFIDLDEYIESSESATISEIFQEFGEKRFREIERERFLSLKERKNLVIATGGGIVLNPLNIEAFKEESSIVYLEGSADYIYSNIKNDSTRPLLNNKDKLQEIQRILDIRKPMYIASAHYKVDVSFRDAEDIVNEIIAAIS